MEIRKIDIILYVVCIITVSIAFYDLTHLNMIEERAVNRCNEHWVEEFRQKCTAYITDEDWGMLNWSVNVSLIQHS